MDIQKNQIDELNLELVLSLEKADYEGNWKKAMKNYGKQVSVPGFRQGHVPMGMIKKQYGKALLAEELNKMINEQLQGYIEENDLKVLGNPLPVADAESGDWDQPDAFKFTYEIGLAPDFTLDLGKKAKFTRYKVEVDDTLINKQVEEVARRYGKLSEPEKSEAKDLLVGTFIELENGDIKPGGIMSDSTISLEFIKDKKTQKQLVGKAIGDEVDVDLEKLAENHSDMGRMLNISHEEVHALADTNFRLRIKEVKRLAPADINQELFDKIYGEGTITTEEEFRARVKSELENNFNRDAENIFRRHVADAAIENVKLDLPDAFLKKWIAASNEKPISKEDLEAEYPNYAKGLKWQLIEGEVIKSEKIEIDGERVLEQAKIETKQQYAQYGLNLEGEQLEGMAKQAISNQDELKRIYNYLYEVEAIKALAEKGKTEEKSVSYDKFVEIAQG